MYLSKNEMQGEEIREGRMEGRDDALVFVSFGIPSSFSLVKLLVQTTAGFIKIGPFYVDYPIGPSNSGWRGNLAELFSHPKIFVVTKLSCRIRDNSSISLIFTRYGIFNILFFDLTLNPAVKIFGFRRLRKPVR